MFFKRIKKNLFETKFESFYQNSILLTKYANIHIDQNNLNYNNY